MRHRWLAAREGCANPNERWKAGMQAITKLAKQKGKAKARARREGCKGLEHALRCTRKASDLNAHDQVLLNLLQNLEKICKAI